jgi:hypothetical protein
LSFIKTSQIHPSSLAMYETTMDAATRRRRLLFL